jgi:HSP20 family protein
MEDITMANLQRKTQQPSGLVDQVIHPFLSVQKELDKALHGFYDIFDNRSFNLSEIENMPIAPSMDLIEEKDAYKLEVEMPGMDEKDVHVTLNENVLTVRGEKSKTITNERKNYISREISYGQYERSLTLPQWADSEKTSASFKKGILCVTIPKKAGSTERSREIKIQSA